MAGDIIQVMLDAISAFVDGLSQLFLDAFDLLVYNPTTGLTDLATWGLVFAGAGIVIGVVNRFTRAS